jgi:transposase-like protein
MTSSTKSLYAGHRFPPELISDTVWLYYRFPLSLRMVEEMLAFRGIVVSHETIRQWGLKFGQEFANLIRRRLPRPGDKWHLRSYVSVATNTSLSGPGSMRTIALYFQGNINHGRTACCCCLEGQAG